MTLNIEEKKERRADIFSMYEMPISLERKTFIFEIKKRSQELFDFIDEGIKENSAADPEISIGIQKLVEAIFWITKSIQPYQ